MGEDGQFPAYDDDGHARVLRAAFRAFCKSGSTNQQNIADELNTFIETNEVRYSLEGIRYLQQRDISAFSTDSDKQIKMVNFKRAIWLWMSQSEVAAPYLANELDRIGMAHPADVLYNFLNEGAPYQTETLEALKGRFALYRPYFDAPNQTIMAGEMTCCVGGDPRSFSLQMKHTWPDGIPSSDFVDGYIIPFGNQLLFQGKLRGWGGPFIMVMRYGRQTDPILKRAEGVLLAGAADYDPSAYPVLMIRAHSPVEIGLLDANDAKFVTISTALLKKGIVDWR